MIRKVFNIQSSTHSIVKIISCKLSSEPQKPSMKTEVPGPKSLELIKHMSEIQMSGNITFVADYANSFGNYIADVDNNIMLDLFCQISSITLGYNHPSLKSVVKSDEYLVSSINRPALGMFPPKDYHERLMRSLLSVAPKGLTHVQTMMCGSCAIENAMKAVFIRQRTIERGGRPFSKEELESCMRNEEPGCPKYSLISFKNGFHGRTLGALSLTRSKPIHKLDIPLMNWPQTDFPLYKYDLEDNVEYNNNQDKRCLEMFEDTIEKWSKTAPVCGVLVEPILAEGGDIHGSNNFFSSLRKICSKRNIAFVVDEVQTGGGPTGTFWAHEKWNLTEPPNIVVFSKKMVLGGYYMMKDFIPNQPYRIFNTWLGEPTKLLLLEAILDTIKNEKLINNTQVTGEHLLEGLKKVQKSSHGKLSNARGSGTFCAVDCSSTESRDQLVKKLRNSGFLLGGSGDLSIRFRPSLTLKSHHVDLFLDCLENTLRDH